MEVSPEAIHDWRVRGVLVDEIKATFCKIPECSRGAYFPWFLQNQHIVALAGLPLSTKDMRDHDDAMLLRTWRFTGGSEKDSLQEITAAIERKSPEEKKCYKLYTLLLSSWSPSPSLDLWIDFGFASCTSEAEESALGVQYELLITKCTFKIFCNAYRHRRLLDLFHSKGLQVKDSAQLRDLLSGDSVGRKSVWDLKQFAIQQTSAGEESRMVLSVMVDYGFINCKNASETRELKKVYTDFFTTHRGNPLALHEACVKGTLHAFLSNIVQGLRGPKYQRLMKNPYPLQDLDESDESSLDDNDVDETCHVPDPLSDPDGSRKSLSGDIRSGRVQPDTPPAPQVSSAVLLAFGAVLGIVLGMLWMQVLLS